MAEAMDSAQQSIDYSQRIPNNVELSTDKAANQLFTREYRKGFELPIV